MDRDPLAKVRAARVFIAQWVDDARRLPDPSAPSPETVSKLASQIESVNRALDAASPALSASDEWKREVAAYAEVLRDVRARLGNFEMALRIRQSQAGGARAKLNAVRSWSDLAKSIG